MQESMTCGRAASAAGVFLWPPRAGEGGGSLTVGNYALESGCGKYASNTRRKCHAAITSQLGVYDREGVEQ